MKQQFITLLLVALLATVTAVPCIADGDVGFLNTIDETSEFAEETGKSAYDRIVLAPVPMINPTLGAGLVGLGMYMHAEDDFGNDEVREDNATLQSISGVAAMMSTSQSWAVGAFHKGFYDDDRYRGTAFLAYGEFNLKFYGIGDDSFLRDHPIKYSAYITAFQPQLLFKVAKNWYVGPKYSIFNWDMGIKFSDLHEKLPDLRRSFTTAGFGLAGEWDTTDHSVFATKGGKLEFSVMDYDDIWGGDFDYAKASANYNHYYSLSSKTVLAGRADLNLSTGSTPFFDMPFLHMRGFPYARYIDKQSASIQGELRYQLSRKWATNLFGGLGWISEEPKDLYKRPVIPTGGAGIRYLIAEDEKMYLGMDVAFGPDSQALYFRVGEWF